MLALLLLSSVGSAAFAQDARICEAGEIYLDCLNRVASEISKSKLQVQSDFNDRSDFAGAVVDLLAELLTSEGAGLDHGAKRDYVGRFFGALGLGTSEGEEGLLVLNFDTDFLDLGENQKAAVRAIVHEPVVSAAAVRALPRAIREARRAELQEEVGDFDDVLLELSWNRESPKVGRTMAVLGGEIVAEARAGLSSAEQELDKASEALAAAIQAAAVEGLDLDQPAPESFDENLAARELERAILAQAKVAEKYRAQLQKGLAGSVPYLAQLADNQPQLYFGASYRRRGEWVGPDEYSIQATYEHGFRNLNDFAKWRQGEECSGTTDCLLAYRARSEQEDAAVTGGARLAFSLEIGRAEAFAVLLPSDDFEYTLDEIDLQIATITFARHFGGRRGLTEKGDDRLLFELAGSYEDVSGDAERQDRLVATAALSRKISGDLTAGFTVVYASKPEYRGEVDKELSARLGLKFTVDRGAERSTD